MVGGVVIEVADVPGRPDVLFVDTRDKNDTCAVMVEKDANSERIQIGDALWWQSGWCMWTPQALRKKQKGMKCGKDFDIKIKKIGYSGVSHPSRRSKTEY